MNPFSHRSSKEYKRLLSRYVNNECTPEERALVEAWYEHFSREKSADKPSTGSTSADQNRLVHGRLWGQIEKKIHSKASNEGKSIRVRRLHTAAGVAASLIFVVLLALVWRLNSKHNEFGAESIVPGVTAATIHLDRNGEGIYLDATLNKDDLKEYGIDVKVENGKTFYVLQPQESKLPYEQYTISTKKGEEIQFILPDQSKVWINAASQISFDSEFGKGAYRDVHLKGEAYFEVQSNKDHPFRVHAKESLVQVLGTSFNVNAYDGIPGTETTLIEGRVLVHDHALKPGQQALFDGSTVQVLNVDPEDFVAWKNGYFNFDGFGFDKIIFALENWYNVEFELPTSVSQERIHGMIPKYQDLQSVLNILEKAGMGKFTIDGRRVKVMS